MINEEVFGTRREFMTHAAQLVSAASLATLTLPSVARATPPDQSPSVPQATEWDLSWLQRLAVATDRAVFDWPSLDDPSDPIVMEIAARYLDNCKSVYAVQKYQACVVLNIRTQAIPAALDDATWERFSLGAEYKVKDPYTHEAAVRNPFWHRAPDPAPGMSSPSLEDLLGRGAVILVCDFALGHLAKRVAQKSGQTADDVHRELRAGFVPGAFAVPSGIFGLARAQNAGCAFVRM